MPQLHFSVDEATAQRLRERAESEGKTLSRYLAQLVKERTSEGWPAEYLEAVIGSCADAPIVEADELALDEVDL